MLCTTQKNSKIDKVFVRTLVLVAFTRLASDVICKRSLSLYKLDKIGTYIKLTPLQNTNALMNYYKSLLKIKQKQWKSQNALEFTNTLAETATKHPLNLMLIAYMNYTCFRTYLENATV